MSFVSFSLRRRCRAPRVAHRDHRVKVTRVIIDCMCVTPHSDCDGYHARRGWRKSRAWSGERSGRTKDVAEPAAATNVAVQQLVRTSLSDDEQAKEVQHGATGTSNNSTPVVVTHLGLCDDAKISFFQSSTGHKTCCRQKCVDNKRYHGSERLVLHSGVLTGWRARRPRPT